VRPVTEITTIVCPHLFSSERHARVIVHHRDGTWQAVCGEHDHLSDCADFQVIGLNHLFDRQADLKGIATLGRDQIAEWTNNGWSVTSFDENESD
jgi:hypothetical protein